MTINGSSLYKLRAITLFQGENLTYGHYRTVIIYDDTEILIDNEKVSFKKVNLNEGEILKYSYIFIYENQNYISNGYNGYLLFIPSRLHIYVVRKR